MNTRNLSLSLLLIIMLLTLTGCPTPLSNEKLSVLKDLDAPEIIVTSPTDYSDYSTVLLLEGVFSDPSLSSATEESNLAVSYSVSGTSISGVTAINIEDGSFSEAVDMSGVSGDRVLELSASDINGNISSLSINIRKPADGGDISGFNVVPGNKAVTLSWEPVPLAESYSIYESSFGRTVSGSDITGTSYSWEELRNGERYYFQITADIPDAQGTDAVSTELSAVPLSSRTFTPWIEETGQSSAVIRWDDSTVLSDFIVERSLYPDHGWEAIRRLDTNEYRDLSLAPNTDYFYRVIPADNRSIISDSSHVMPDRVPASIVGSCSTEGAAKACCTRDGKYAYVAADSAGLKIINISNPAGPEIVGSCSTNNAAYDIALSENYVYIADYDAGLTVVDITDSNNPVKIGSCDTDGFAMSIAVSGSTAYVADHGQGLQIIDISDPSNPVIKGHKTMSDNTSTRNLLIKDNRLYINAEYYIEIFDIEADGSLSNNNSINIGSRAISLAVSGNNLYIGTNSNKIIKKIDLTDNSLSDVYTFEDEHLSFTTNKMYIDENSAYLATNEGIKIFDISNPDSPVLLNEIETAGTLNDLFLCDGFIFSAADGTGFTVMDLFNPAAASLEATCSISGNAFDLEVSADYAYIASDSGGLIVVKLANFEVIGSCTLPGTSYRVFISGPYAFVACASSGLQIINIINPSNPVLLGSLDSESNNINDVVVHGSYAYIADNNNGLLIADISNPATPQLISSLKIPQDGYGQYLCFRNNIIYLTSAKNSNPKYLYAIDTSNKQIPVVISETELPGSDFFGQSIYVLKDIAYIACGADGLYCYDISDPKAPVEKSHYDTDGTARDVTVQGDLAYVADAGNGLVILDVSDPTAPDPITTCDTNGYARGVSVAGSNAYVADQSGGLAVINLLGN